MAVYGIQIQIWNFIAVLSCSFIFFCDSNFNFSKRRKHWSRMKLLRVILEKQRLLLEKNWHSLNMCLYHVT